MPLESPDFHTCEPLKSMPDPPPHFYTKDDAKDTNTGETIRLVMLAIAGAYGWIAVQVDYCPWCGALLTPYTRERSMKRGRELADYREYRKRWVKQGTAGAPLDFTAWQDAANDFDQIDVLLRHASPEHTPGLFKAKQQLRDKLALGVVLPPTTPAEEGDSEVS